MKREFLELKLRIPVNGLYSIILYRMYLCKRPNEDIIPFAKINSKLGTSLQLNKKQIWELLLFFHDLGMLEIVTNHGITLNYKIDSNKFSKK